MNATSQILSVSSQEMHSGEEEAKVAVQVHTVPFPTLLSPRFLGFQLKILYL